MPIELVDMRISGDNTTGVGPTNIPTGAASAALIGDIGIQTAGVSVANQGLVRVFLTGSVTVNIADNSDGNPVVVRVFRITSLGPPIQIYENSVNDVATNILDSMGIDAIDFPSAAEVATGQIQYTARIFQTNADPQQQMSTRTFSGVAVAGNFTG